MKFCPYCGKALKEDMLFCPSCGKALTVSEHSSETVSESACTQTAAPAKTKPRFSKKMLLPILAVIVIAVAAVLLSSPFGGSFSEDTEAIQDAAYSVVLLNCYDYYDNLYGTGSGFAAFDNDIIITNHHVIQGDVYRMEAVREDGSTFPIESVIAYDEEKDFAILRAPDHKLKPLGIGDSMNLKKGEKTVAIGSPTGFTNTVSTGIFGNYLDIGNYFQILSSASLSPGSSGGALFNDRGEVIGITSGAYTDGNDLYYSIPIYYVQELYNNRTPGDELTVAEFYNLSEHPYTADYILAYGNKLHNQTVTVYGYVTGFAKDIFLVSSPELIPDIQSENLSDFELTVLLRELRSAGYALQIDITRNHLSIDNLFHGDFIAIDGTVAYFNANDVRLIAKNILK